MSGYIFAVNFVGMLVYFSGSIKVQLFRQNKSSFVKYDMESFI